MRPILLAVLFLFSFNIAAQPFPTKPVRLAGIQPE